MSQEFLRSVLPSQGKLFYCTKADMGGKAHTLDGMIADAPHSGSDTYFATASFRDDAPSRKDEYLLYRRCVTLDVDVKPDNPKHFADQKSALSALKTWYESFLTPSWIVNSGYGWHVYWSLNQDVNAETARKLVDVLHNNLLKFGDERLYSDITTSRRVGGLLRIPGSFNYKHGGVKQVVAFKTHNDPWSVDAIMSKDATPPVTTQAPHDPLAGAHTVQTATTSSGAGPMFADEGKPIDVVKLTRNCAIIADIVNNQAGVKEPAWKLLADVLTFIDDKDEARKQFHIMSANHPSYSKDETDKKFSYSLHRFNDVSTRGMNAPRCQTLRAAHCGGKTDMCASCPIFKPHDLTTGGVLSAGRVDIKQSFEPLSLTTVGDQRLTVFAPVPAPRSYNLAFNTSVDTQYYVDTKDNSLRFRRTNYIDKAGRKQKDIDMLVSNKTFYVDRTVNGMDEGNGIILVIESYDKLNKTVERKEVYVANKKVTRQLIPSVLTEFNINTTTDDAPAVLKYVETGRRDTSDNIEKPFDSAEWVKSTDGTDAYVEFALGAFRVHKGYKGRVTQAVTQKENSPASMLGIGPLIHTKASVKTPDDMVKTYFDAVLKPAFDKDTKPEGAFALLSGLGGILACMTRSPGLTMWFGGEGGAGKSFTLKSIMGFYGDTTRGTHLSDDDSKAGAIASKSVLKNLPVCKDEVRDADAQELVRSFLVSTGVAGSRATEKGKLDTDRGSYSNLNYMTSNLHPFQNFDRANAQHEAAMSRVLYVDNPTKNEFMIKYKDISSVESAKNNCYGWLGLDFAAWCLWHCADIKKIVTETEDKITAVFGKSSGYNRFKISALTCAVIAAKYVKTQFKVDDKECASTVSRIIDYVKSTTVITNSVVYRKAAEDRVQEIRDFATGAGESNFERMANRTSSMFTPPKYGAGVSCGRLIMADDRPNVAIRIELYAAALPTLLYKMHSKAGVPKYEYENGLDAVCGRVTEGNNQMWKIELTK